MSANEIIALMVDAFAAGLGLGVFAMLAKGRA